MKTNLANSLERLEFMTNAATSSTNPCFYFAPTHAHLQPLEGKWTCERNQGKYRIFFNIENPSQSHAEITSLHERTITHIHWDFPVLSKAFLSSLIIEQPQSFTVEIKQEAGQFKVLLHSTRIKKEIEGMYSELNKELFSQKTNMLKFFGDYYREIEDHKAREAFFSISCKDLDGIKPTES